MAKKFTGAQSVRPIPTEFWGGDHHQDNAPNQRCHRVGECGRKRGDSLLVTVHIPTIPQCIQQKMSAGARKLVAEAKGVLYTSGPQGCECHPGMLSWEVAVVQRDERGRRRNSCYLSFCLPRGRMPWSSSCNSRDES